jgi:hypothetical protein
LIAAGVVEPGDTVTVEVAGGENLKIPGSEFIEAGDGTGRAELNEFSGRMAEIGLAPSDVDRSMTSNTVSPFYESTSRVEYRSLDDRMNDVNSAIENSALSDLHRSGDDTDTETADDNQFEQDASDSDGDASESDSDITYSPSSSESESSLGESLGDSGSTTEPTDFVGPIGPNP